MANLQMAMFAPKSEWVPPLELPDITSAGTIAIVLACVRSGSSCGGTHSDVTDGVLTVSVIF